jgi:hypothetical protein
MVYDDMRFYTFNEFYDQGVRIKNHFINLSIDDKLVYRMYVYSNRHIKDYLLDKIWEYLNEPFGSTYYVSYDMLGLYQTKR